MLDHLATSGAINLGQSDDLDAINRWEPTLPYVGQITAAKCRLDLFNSAPVTVTGKPSID